MLLLIFQVFLAVTIAKSAFEESLEPNDTMISETFAQISRISLDINPVRPFCIFPIT